jgi:hypothetical protein
MDIADYQRAFTGVGDHKSMVNGLFIVPTPEIILLFAYNSRLISRSLNVYASN